jgi:ribosomal protein S27AE
MTNTELPDGVKTDVDFTAGFCPRCGYGIGLEGHKTQTVCPRCSTLVKLGMVRGTYREAVPCNADCQYARGRLCACSCGGRNHRRGYIAMPELVPGWVRERDVRAKAAAETRAARKAADVKAAAEAIRETNRREWLTRFPILAALLGDDSEYRGAGGFAWDMRCALEQGRMTERQAEAAARMIERDRADRERIEQREAAKAAAIAAGVKVPTGRQRFTGIVVTAKWQPAYTYGAGETLKILVVTEAGWKVWVTAPRSMENVDTLIETKAEIAMTASLEPSEDDQLFGFGKRPTYHGTTGVIKA